jgi:hypothetical protein
MKTKVLFLLMLLTGAASSFAEGGQTSTLTWTLNNGTLTIGGTGIIPPFSSAPWWRYSRSSITAVIIEDGVTEIGSNAFSRCDKLTAVSIPESVTIIHGYAFSVCSSLTAVTIPNSVTASGNHIFYNCSSLASVTIGNGLKVFGGSAFAGCSSLAVFIYLNPEPQGMAPYVFDGVDLSKAALYVPAQSVEAYRTADVWKDFGAILPYEPAAIDAPATENALRIFPNPVGESFRISVPSVSSVSNVPKDFEICITDAGGQVVLRQTVGGDESVFVGRLPQGVYLVRVNGKTFKIIRN